MIRVTDMTLSCLDAFQPSAEQLKRLYVLLSTVGTDVIEMPASVYDKIRPSSTEKIMLRLSHPGEKTLYPEINRFICRKSGFISPSDITQEIQLNDVKEINLLTPSESGAPVRIVGLDDILCHNYGAAFSKIKARVNGTVEFCPEDNYSCATANAVEWITEGGIAIAASFGGIGGKAALEEVLVSLQIIKRHKPNATFAMFPQIAAVMEEIISARYPDRKAVIGRRIFDVESGIHIDGILKKPQMYEPFSPELVGNSRTLIMGKHSGRKSIAAKLAERDLSAGDFDTSQILHVVREESIEKKASLTDEEFYAISLKYRL